MRVKSLNGVKRERSQFKPAWQRGRGDKIYENPKFGRIQAVVITKEDGTPLYDQIIWIEPVGAVTVPINLKGEIGLQEVERPVILKEDVEPYNRPGQLDVNFADLGRKILETPRGFPVKSEKPIETALRESSEELQKVVIELKKIGEINPNTAFFVNSIPVYLARINSDLPAKIPPDLNERILKVSWYSLAEIKRMIREGKIICGFTLAALALAIQHLE